MGERGTPAIFCENYHDFDHFDHHHCEHQHCYEQDYDYHDHHLALQGVRKVLPISSNIIIMTLIFVMILVLIIVIVMSVISCRGYIKLP